MFEKNKVTSKLSEIQFDFSNRKEKIIGLVSLALALIIVFIFNATNEYNKTEAIISAVVIVSAIAILFLYSFVKIKFEKFVVLAILLLGCLSSVIQPIMNVPDETSHFIKADIVSNGGFILDSSNTVFEVNSSCLELLNNVSVNYKESTIRGQQISDETVEIGCAAAGNIFFEYAPQALGIRIAKLFNMDIIWMMWIGRMLNALCYALLIGLAVKIAPRFKFALFFVAALPMSIHQAGSFSPDATINGLSILLIAYFLYIYCNDDVNVKKREFFTFLILGILVTLAKVTNILLVGLFVLIPMKKFTNKYYGLLMKAVMIILVVVSGGIFYLYFAKFTPFNDYLEANGVNSGEQIHYILSNFFVWLKNFVYALIVQFDAYINMLNNYGWLSYTYSVLNVVMIYEFAKVCFKEKGVQFGILAKIVMLLIFAGTYAATAGALYISWTPVGSAGISGVQGRYLIPCIALLPLVFSKDNDYINYGKIRYNVDVLLTAFMVSSMLIITATTWY